MVTGVVPSPPPALAFRFYRAPRRVQQSHCLSFLLSSVANSRPRASFRKSICAQDKVPTNLVRVRMHSEGLELTKLIYNTWLEDNLIRHYCSGYLSWDRDVLR